MDSEVCAIPARMPEGGDAYPATGLEIE